MDDKKFQSLTKPQQDVVLKIAAEAERQGVNPKLAIAIAEAETGGGFSHYRGDKVLTSPAGAKGVMQIMPDTARLFNKNLGAEIEPDNEDSNIKGGVFILKHLLTKYKSPRNAVALYNASPRAVETFIKTYETDPDKAILSLPEETQKYSLRISKNFNLDDDKETGLIPVGEEAQSSGNPFEGYESEATKFKAEQKNAEQNAPPVANPEDQQGGINDREVGAMVGAGVNALLPMLTDPQVSPKIDTSKAVEAERVAQDKLELARRNLEQAVPQGAENLEETYRQSQGELERLKNEQRLAQEQLRGLPRSAPTVEMPSASVVADAPSRTKAGDAGAVNWVHSMADDVPEVVANRALNMRADNERGGQAIIDADMAARQRQANLGLGDYGLTRTEGGVQLALPPTTVAERQAEIDRENKERQAELDARTEQARFEQERQAYLLEQQRLAHEAELERLRQERSAAGQRHNVISGQTRQAAPLKRALTKAETDAEIAQRKLARAQEQPNAVGRVLERTGVGSKKIGAIPRTITGGGLGYVGVMSYQEALARFKAGDTSEGVLQALQAGSATAALLPPAGKTMTKVRGAGTLGTLGLGTYQLGRRLLKDRPQDEE
jgi:hypothetical protein